MATVKSFKADFLSVVPLPFALTNLVSISSASLSSFIQDLNLLKIFFFSEKRKKKQENLIFFNLKTKIVLVGSFTQFGYKV